MSRVQPRRFPAYLLPVRRVALVAVAACVTATAACGGGDRQPAEPPVPHPAPAANGESAPAGPQAPAGSFAGTTDPVEQSRPGLNPAVLQDVRTARHPDFERVVFEFQPPSVPGYRVEYADAPVLDCGAGQPLKVEGAVHLVVRLSPAQAHTEAGEVTVRDRERRPGLAIVHELELSCDFEGEVSWVLGLSGRRPYRVSELAAPPRLVVDIQR